MKKYILPSLFVLFFFSLSLTQIITTDTWWNLSDGRMFYSTGWVPATDPYSYVTEGKQWVNGYWLSGVLLYPIYRMGGGAALVLFQSFMAGLIFFLLLSFPRKRESKDVDPRFRGDDVIRWASLVVCVLIAQPRFQVRAELFGLLSTALLLWLLFQYQRGLSVWKALLGIVMTIVFWTNTHASFPQSFLILGVFLLGEFLTALCKGKGFTAPEFAPLTRSRWLSLAGIFVISLLATGITPYSYKIWQIPKFFVDQHKFVSQNLNEWIPLGYLWLKSIDPFIATAIILAVLGGFLGIALNWREASISWALLWLVAFAMFASSVRHMSFFAMTILPVLVLNWSSLNSSFPHRLFERRSGAWSDGTARLARRKRESKDVDPRLRGDDVKKIYLSITCLCMILVTFDRLTDRGIIQRANYEAFGVGFYNRTVPKEAVQFAVENQLPGRVFHTYDLGSYLMFHWPEQKVFIDTRMWFRGADDFRAYIDLMREPEKHWDSLVEKYGIQTVILKHLSREADLLLPYLAKHPDWAIIFCDARGIVFLKRSAENEKWIGKFASRIDLESLFERAEKKYRPHWLWGKTRLFRPREIPFELYWVAHLYFRLGMYDDAEKAFKQILEHASDLYDVYFFLGKIEAEHKNFRQAIKLFEKSLSIQPDFLPARRELKMSRMLAGFRVIQP